MPGINSLDMQNKSGDVSMNDMAVLFQKMLKPLEEKMDSINANLANRVISLEKMHEILEE